MVETTTLIPTPTRSGQRGACSVSQRKRPFRPSGWVLSMALILTLCGLMSVLTSCSSGDETIYLPDPTDAPSTKPMVTVVYSADALGDRSYNDLIYSGVENVSAQKGLRTLHLSPATREEGLAYLEQLFRQMEAPTDTVRRLLIVASPDYDTWLRQNNKRLEGNPHADLLYFETSTPLDGKGSTLFMPYYGAMYEAGAIAPHFMPKALLIGANPEDEPVREAMEGFKDGFATEWLAPQEEEKRLTTMYIGQHAGEGYSISDTLALKMMQEYEGTAHDAYVDPFIGHKTTLVPVCGGAGSVFGRLAAIVKNYIVMGIDVQNAAANSQFSAVKHIDRAVEESIRQWFLGEGIPKHQTLGLASGFTELVVHAHDYFSSLGGVNSHQTAPSDDLLRKIHEEAIRKETLPPAPPCEGGE